MAVELFAHNKETYQNIEAMFETRNRVGVVQPTGTGKSFLYLKWIEDHPRDTFTILAPSTEIFTQLKEYAEESGNPAMLDAVQMISYQSLLKMTDEEIQEIRPDKMVLDEFHRTGAELWGPSLQRLLDTNPEAQILGASATPVRYLDDSKDMASALFDRNLAVEMTLGEAVQRKILPTPTYVPVWYDMDGTMERYKQDINKRPNPEERKELLDTLEQARRRLESSYGAEDILQKHLPHDHSKLIVFCRDREHLEEMKKTVPQWMGKINGNVHSYVSVSAQSDKDEQLKAFKADNADDAIKLLFTVDRLNEGLHVKGVDGVIMLRPTVSPIIYLQQMGRALAAGSKSPVIFDMVNNYQSVQIPMRDGSNINVFEKEFRDAMESRKDTSAFRIYEDMAAFSSIVSDLELKLYFSMEEKWESAFSLLKQFIDENQRFPAFNEVYQDFRLGQWCEYQKRRAQRPDFPPNRFIKLKEIGLLDNTRANRWEHSFQLLQDFVSEFGRLPTAREKYQGEGIGSWLSIQKKMSTRDSYPPERHQKLTDLGVFLIQPELWDERFQLVKTFVETKGRLPRQHESYEGIAIGHWCSAQRERAKDPSFSPDKREKLRDLGILNNRFHDKWEESFQALAGFVSEFHRLPMTKEVYNGFKIGSWLSKQREALAKSACSDERVARLQSLGVMSNVYEDTWDSKYMLLQEFIQTFNRFPKDPEDFKGVHLGKWTSAQKSNAKSPNYPADRLEKLQAIGLLNSSNEIRWEQNLDLVKTFQGEHGRLPYAREEYQGVNLGKWLRHQREYAQNADYPEDRRQKLEAIGAIKRDPPSLLEQIAEAESLKCPCTGRTGLGLDGPGAR